MMLARMEMDIDKALEQYDTVGNAVFAKPRFLHSSIRGVSAVRPKYPSRNMAEALKCVIKKGLEDELNLVATSAHKVPFASNPARCRR